MTETNATFAATLIGAFARLGVRHVCLSPGSRNTPLSLAIAAAPELTDWVHIDERSSGFFALGVAKATRRPVLIVTTSGTAAAELHPAIVEARYGRVPIIAITADRPFELRDVGAPQTIDQQNLYGSSVHWAHDIEATSLDARRTAALAARLFATAGGQPPGPVHLNVRFREPLVDAIDGNPAVVGVPEVISARAHVDDTSASYLADAVSARRGVLVVGPQDDPDLAAAATAFAAATGWPIIGDALSGLRCGRHERAHVIEAGDPLAWAGWLDTASPEMVIRCGALPTSKPIWRWLEEHPSVPQVFIEPTGWRDPTASASTVVRGDPTATLQVLAERVRRPAPTEWIERWRAADALASGAVDDALGGRAFPNEPAIARALSEHLTEGSALWVGSSMPVRDVDAFFRSSDRAIDIKANRGANGIDGLLSSGSGYAAVTGAGTVILAGDLSVLHDLSGLATVSRLAIPLTIVVVHNDGGGIFHFLPQAGHPEFERYFGTPHGVDFTLVAHALGITAESIDDPDRFAEALLAEATGPRLLQLSTDREENVTVHRDIREAVAASLVGA